MSKELTIPKTIQELVEDESKFIEMDILNGILNQNPPKTWVRQYEGFNYLPIDKHEYLLKRLFQDYKIEILREGQLFNSIYCTVRVHYLHPVKNEWRFQDGTGAVDVQKKKGSSPAMLENINFGAIMKGLPAAESYAIKDACEKIGNIFGANLNRKDTLGYELSKATTDKYTDESTKSDYEEIKEGLELVFDLYVLTKYFNDLDLKLKADKEVLKMFNERKQQIKNEKSAA